MKTVDTSIWNAVISAGIVVQLTLLLLTFLSIVSWAIIAWKFFQIRRVRANIQNFHSDYAKVRSWVDIVDDFEDSKQNTEVARIVQTMIQEWSLIREESGLNFSLATEELERSLEKKIRVELASLEHRLSWLASIGSVAPFVGLFGTVWGIMNSFQKIGAMGSASLAVVAPGISEALVATAVGLFTAIPATFFYNQFVTKIREIELVWNDIGTFLIGLIKRHWFKQRVQG